LRGFILSFIQFNPKIKKKFLQKILIFKKLSIPISTIKSVLLCAAWLFLKIIYVQAAQLND